MSSTVTNEPMSKRQRIDSVDIISDGGEKSDGKCAFTIVSNGEKHGRSSVSAPPDILSAAGSFAAAAVGSGSASLAGNPVTETNVPRGGDSDELDNAAAVTLGPMSEKIIANGIHGGEFPDLLKTSAHLPPADSTQPSCSSSPQPPSARNKSTETSRRPRTSVSESNLDEFQTHLMKQCLCDISDRLLWRPFESYYYKDHNGVRRSVPLNEWPAPKLIQFLSNVQLLFDVYLKQSVRRQICTRIMQLCDHYNEHNIIDDIFSLYEYNNKFVQFLAGRVMASCMIIAKDKQELYENWLGTIIGNLVFERDEDERVVQRKITLSLEIILRILEWRDFEEHPLEDTVDLDGRAADAPDDEAPSLPVVAPPIEYNYFAMQFNADASTMEDRSIAPMTSQSHAGGQPQPPSPGPAAAEAAPTSSCHLQTLSDFTTTDLKCNVLDALKNRWSNLVDSMSGCIADLHRNDQHIELTENTILTFLAFWERIISVQANLSVDSTLPFHEKLTTILDILIEGNLPVPIYKQILTLFNESLCYGTTLALQSVLPEETNKLAWEIFNSVKRQRIFNSLPVQQTTPENDVSFIGYRRPTISYPLHHSPHHFDNDDDSAGSLGRNHYPYDDDEPENGDDGRPTSDHILLQKLVLLILKAIAVTVKPVRGDDSSDDSSMDGCNSNSSSAYDAYQATVQIESATHDVLKNLRTFMINKLNHHPETHFSKMVVHLFADQDDYLIEAMVCMLDTTIAFTPRQPQRSASAPGGRNQFRALRDMLSPVFAFLEFLDLIAYQAQSLLDMLCSNETCFLLYLLRILKYICSDWETFTERCNEFTTETGIRGNGRDSDDDRTSVLASTMLTLRKLRKRIVTLVSKELYPYDIKPIVQLLVHCECLYEPDVTDFLVNESIDED